MSSQFDDAVEEEPIQQQTKPTSAETEGSSTATAIATMTAKAHDDDNPSASSNAGEQPMYKSEAHLTSGLGYGGKKRELIKVFWTLVWPLLEEIGWTRTKSIGCKLVTGLFFPPHITRENGKRGVDYFDRIRLVITRILERKNDDEAAIADRLIKARSGVAEVKDIPSSSLKHQPASPSPTNRRSARGTSKSETRIDLSWKDGGTIYPKKSSRVGDDFQATNLPKAHVQYGSTPSTRSESGTYCDQIWDHSKGNAKDVLLFLQEGVPRNRWENALAVLHKRDYRVSDAGKEVEDIKPVDGSDWTDDEKERFHAEIFRLRKDLKAVSKSIGKSMVSCLTYYLGTFKKSAHYRVLKTVCVEEREAKMAKSVHGVDECAVCGDGGSLIICDACEGEYHISCLVPRLQSVPEGSWDCDECVNRKFVAAHERIIKHSKLYEPVKTSNKRRKLAVAGAGTDVDTMENEQDEANDATAAKNAKPKELVYCPTQATKDIVREFAASLSSILSGGGG